MNENKSPPRPPDVKGFIEVAGWVHPLEDGTIEIKCSLGKHFTLKKHIPKPRTTETPQQPPQNIF